jgi:flagellar motor switch protein FliM
MTQASDSETAASALSKKVKSASFDISIFPHLGDLAIFAGKFCASRLSDAVNVAAQPLETTTSMRNAQNALGSLSENTNYYWFGEHADDHAMLVGLAPSFLSALSEALLGGGFEMADEEASPTALDSELAQMFVEDLVDGLVSRLSETITGIHPGSLEFTRSATSVKKILKDVQTSALFSMSIEMMLENEKLSSFLTFHLPIEYLEEKGMLAQISKSPVGSGENTKWYADMLDNVNHTEIELPVLIAKYKMTLSELSKLKVDQVIPLEENAHNSLDVTLKSDLGVVSLCKGKLGTFKENKAVKVISEIRVS